MSEEIKTKIKIKKILSVIIIVIGTISILWSLFLLTLFIIITPYRINGNSMDETLNEGELIATYSYNKKYKRGDILVVKKEGMKYCPEEEKDELLIKRVVALSGDEIAFVINNDYVDFCIKKENNWCVIDEPYIKEPMKKETFTTYPYFYNSISDITVGYKIEENEVFILGDNRNNSLDSRIYGTLNVDYICNIYWFNISENPFLNFIYKYFL